MRALHLQLLGIALWAVAARAPAAEQVSIAAAANLAYVLTPLDAEFNRSEPGVVVTSAIGASGSLVAQIREGAPYDVFLSADTDFPKKLVAAGGADPSSLVTFAFGRLVLWTTRPGLALASVESALRDPSVRRIAMANPETAPYGRAAEQVLARLGLSSEVKPKIVIGENITQTAQFVSSGNAELGFVALSLVVAPNLKGKGRWIEVPASLYAPIAQGAVLTSRGASNPAARRYLKFLDSPPAREVFARFGYILP
jgi:molybdate transport system substrate-binding protein